MDLLQFDLNLLVAFDVLMVERSVTRAAQRMSIGQSAMSATLARLRRAMGDPILVRNGRTLVATPLAESLVGPVRRVLDELEGILADRSEFDPASAERTFSVIVNDYVAMTFLLPLIRTLSTTAPGVRLRISPTGDDYVDKLRRGQSDLLVVPSAALGNHQDFPHEELFSDRYVVAVDRDHPEVGDHITYEQFTTLPYLLTASGETRMSIGDMQLDALGIPRNVEITAGFGLAPFLLNGTRLVLLIQERLARQLQTAAGLKLLESPVALKPVTMIMVWTDRHEAEPGHQWLRRQLVDLATALPQPLLPD